MQDIVGLRCESDPVYITGLKPGDLYMAKRNTGWKLLTCRKYNKDTRVVFPTDTMAYVYNDDECFKVLEA